MIRRSIKNGVARYYIEVINEDAKNVLNYPEKMSWCLGRHERHSSVKSMFYDG